MQSHLAEEFPPLAAAAVSPAKSPKAKSLNWRALNKASPSPQPQLTTPSRRRSLSTQDASGAGGHVTPPPPLAPGWGVPDALTPEVETVLCEALEDNVHGRTLASELAAASTSVADVAPLPASPVAGAVSTCSSPVPLPLSPGIDTQTEATGHVVGQSVEALPFLQPQEQQPSEETASEAEGPEAVELPIEEASHDGRELLSANDDQAEAEDAVMVQSSTVEEQLVLQVDATPEQCLSAPEEEEAEAAHETVVATEEEGGQQACGLQDEQLDVHEGEVELSHTDEGGCDDTAASREEQAAVTELPVAEDAVVLPPADVIVTEEPYEQPLAHETSQEQAESVSAIEQEEEASEGTCSDSSDAELVPEAERGASPPADATLKQATLAEELELSTEAAPAIDDSLSAAMPDAGEAPESVVDAPSAAATGAAVVEASTSEQPPEHAVTEVTVEAEVSSAVFELSSAETLVVIAPAAEALVPAPPPADPPQPVVTPSQLPAVPALVRVAQQSTLPLPAVPPSVPVAQPPAATPCPPSARVDALLSRVARGKQVWWAQATTTPAQSTPAPLPTAPLLTAPARPHPVSATAVDLLLARVRAHLPATQ